MIYSYSKESINLTAVYLQFLMSLFLNTGPARVNPKTCSRQDFRNARPATMFEHKTYGPPIYSRTTCKVKTIKPYLSSNGIRAYCMDKHCMLETLQWEV
jgi:hypothetical protein